MAINNLLCYLEHFKEIWKEWNKFIMTDVVHAREKDFLEQNSRHWNGELLQLYSVQMGCIL